MNVAMLVLALLLALAGPALADPPTDAIRAVDVPPEPDALAWRATGLLRVPDRVGVDQRGLQGCVAGDAGETWIHFDASGRARGVEIRGDVPEPAVACLRRVAGAARVAPGRTGAIVRFVHGSGAVKVMAPSPPLSLTLRIDAEGLTLGGAESVFGADLELPCRTPGCAFEGDDVGSAYDGSALRAALIRVKDAHPTESDLILVPSPSVPYRVLVWAMDVTRSDPARPGDCDGRCLFPRVVIAGGGAP